jgi:hypothetical protein
MKLSIIKTFTLGIFVLTGCRGGGWGHAAGPGPNDERVCVSGGARCTQYRYKYPEDARTPLDRMNEDSARQAAYQKGEPYFPAHYAGESTGGYLQRMGEESKRQDAYKRGEPYLPSQRSGESFNHWVKRSSETSSNGPSSVSASSPFGR